MRQTVEAICTLTALFAVLVANAQVANTPVPRYDLLLKGGHVIDPANGLDGKRDVAVLVGKVAAVKGHSRQRSTESCGCLRSLRHARPDRHPLPRWARRRTAQLVRSRLAGSRSSGPRCSAHR